MTMIVGAVFSLVVNLMWLLIPAEKCSLNHTCIDYIIFPILLSGIGYGIFAGTAWNGAFYLVERQKIGTAIGLQGSICNLTLLAIPPVFGWLSDHSQQRDQGYFDPIVMQCAISGLAILLSFCNYFYDRTYNDGVLRLNVEDRNKLFVIKKFKFE